MGLGLRPVKPIIQSNDFAKVVDREESTISNAFEENIYTALHLKENPKAAGKLRQINLTNEAEESMKRSLVGSVVSYAELRAEKLK